MNADGRGRRPHRSCPAPVLALVLIAPLPAFPRDVAVDPAKTLQTFDGWGTSLAWWAHLVGGMDDAKINEAVDLLTDPVAGLGFTVFRYNLGGGDDPAHRHMRPGGDIPCFQPAPGKWDWTADANQRKVLLRIQAKVKDGLYEAFSNSPPWWMTRSGCSSGSADGGTNLKPDRFDDFADHLVEVVRHFKTAWGVTFRTLEPTNEPDATWWKANGRQEGCHFDPPEQARLIEACAARLKAKGLPTGVAANDANNIDACLGALQSFPPRTLAGLARINTHSYFGGKRRELAALARRLRKPVVQSETGPLNMKEKNTVVALAQRTIRDLLEMEATVWCNWQFIDDHPAWGSLVADWKAGTWRVGRKFHMEAQFSRFLRPGFAILETPAADTLAALDPKGTTLVLVAVNAGDSEEAFAADLSKFRTAGPQAEAHRTSDAEACRAVGPVAVVGGRLRAALPKASITTFVVPVRR